MLTAEHGRLMNPVPEPERCPRCGHPVDIVGGSEGASEGPTHCCRACGWSRFRTSEHWWRRAWWMWLLLGFSPVAVSPFLLELAARLGVRSGAQTVAILGGPAVCLMCGFGLARAIVTQPALRLVVGLIAGGGLIVLNLTIALAAACSSG